MHGDAIGALASFGSAAADAPRGWRDGRLTRWWQWPSRLVVKVRHRDSGRVADVDWMERNDPDEYWRRVAW
jgi:hypothetical protein